MIGAPLDTMTLLHHAEHLADICGKRVVRHAYPMKTPGGVRWLTAEEFDTSVPVVASLDDDYFARIVQDFLGSGRGAANCVGSNSTGKGEMHSMQNFATERFSVPQAGQTRAITPPGMSQSVARRRNWSSTREPP